MISRLSLPSFLVWLPAVIVSDQPSSPALSASQQHQTLSPPLCSFLTALPGGTILQPFPLPPCHCWHNPRTPHPSVPGTFRLLVCSVFEVIPKFPLPLSRLSSKPRSRCGLLKPFITAVYPLYQVVCRVSTPALGFGVVCFIQRHSPMNTICMGYFVMFCFLEEKI